MARRAKMECSTEEYDSDLQILHLSEQLKATQQRCPHAV